MACSICTHEKRAEIEQALLCRSLGDLDITVESVAKQYNVKPVDLQVHALMHTTSQEENAAPNVKPTTLVEAVRFREAQSVRQSIAEYQATQSIMGRKVRELISEHTADEPTLHKLSRASVDLYLGLGGEIRNAVDTLVKMNSAINGEDNKGIEGLAQLVNAIATSGRRSD